MDKNEIRGWTGPKEGREHKHILGQMRAEVQASGRRIVVLEVYRHAVDLAAEQPAEVDVCNVVYGETVIKCDAEGCDYVAIWRLGRDVLRERAAQDKKAIRVYQAE